jgi:hypothetical protein
MAKRFVDLTETDLLELNDYRYSKKTKYNNNYAEKLLDTFIMEKTTEIPTTFDEWDKLLELFFASVRKMNGGIFSTNGLNCLYHGIARIMLAKFEVDIRSPEFSKCRGMIKNMKAIAKTSGHGVVKHTDVITQNDIQKLGQMTYQTPVFAVQSLVLNSISFCKTWHREWPRNEKNRSHFYRR